MFNFISIFILIFPMILSAQDIEFLEKVNHGYENYREKTINHRRFKHSDIKPLIKNLEKKNFTVNKIGESAQHRDIYLVKWGNGPVKLFLWSQMHGDEPTATMALLDIFNLHDQSTRYSVGNSSKPATLSFLAPTVDYEKSISPKREDAMKLISRIFK